MIARTPLATEKGSIPANALRTLDSSRAKFGQVGAFMSKLKNRSFAVS